MYVHLACESCGQSLRAKADDAGKTGKCPACSSQFVVPEAGEDGAAAPRCHFCDAKLTPGDVQRFEQEQAEAQQAALVRRPDRRSRREDEPTEYRRLFVEELLGVYPTCALCHESSCENRQDLEQEYAARERQRRSCLLVMFLLMLLSALLSLASVLYSQ